MPPSPHPPARALPGGLASAGRLVSVQRTWNRALTSVTRLLTRGKFRTTLHSAPRPLVSIWGHHLPSQLTPQAAASQGPPRDDASTPRGPTTACPLASAPHALLHSDPGGSCVSRLLRIRPVKATGSCEPTLPSPQGAPPPQVYLPRTLQLTPPSEQHGSELTPPSQQKPHPGMGYRPNKLIFVCGGPNLGTNGQYLKAVSLLASPNNPIPRQKRGSGRGGERERWNREHANRRHSTDADGQQPMSRGPRERRDSLSVFLKSECPSLSL